MSSSSLQPLQSALDAILGRLAALESQAGIKAPSPSTSTSIGSAAAAVVVEDAEEESIPPALSAYDEHMTQSLQPFIDACNAIDGLAKANIGPNVQTVWTGIRSIIIIGTKCKKPSNNDAQSSFLMTHLQPVQDAMKAIRNTRLDRKFDWHIKAIMEMLVCASWVIVKTPPAPSSFIKDTVGSSDFWSNKIRKEYKNKKDDDEGQKHITFCDTMKTLILDLANYVKAFHLSGLMWNPNGVAIEEYKAANGDEPKINTPNKTTDAPAAVVAANTATAPIAKPLGGGGDLMKELAAKRTSDGTSAATGLKKVTRDQQTWRKEFNKDNSSSNNNSATTTTSTTAATVRPSQIKASQKSAAAAKKPVCTFQSIGSKWIVEYQTKTSNPNGVCTVEIQNPKEQVYIYKCEEATIQIKGKVKSVILDSCKKTNLVFESAISSCEVVNCKRIQIQATGICPSFSIDKTDGCLVYLSEEAVSVTNFVTSKSTEMNVSWPDDKSGEQREAPIPEQFVHRLNRGAVTSEVSDLYH